MANDDLSKQFNILIQKLERLGVQSTTLKRLRSEFKSLGDDTAAANDKLDEMRDRITALSNRFASMNDSLKDISAQLAEQVGNASTINQIVSKQRGLYSKISSIAVDLNNDAMGMIDLNKRDIAARLEKLEAMAAEFRLQRQIAQEKLRALGFSDEDLRSSVAYNKKKEELLKLADKQGKKDLQRADNLREILLYNQNEDVAVQGLIEKTSQRLELEKQISKAVGVTGAIVEGTGALMERLGMRSGIFHDAMKDAAETMREQSKALLAQLKLNRQNYEVNQQIKKDLEDQIEAEQEVLNNLEKGTAEYEAQIEKIKELKKERGEIVKSLKTELTFADRTQIALEGAGILAKGFGQALRDPAAITAAIVSAFLDVNKASVDIIRLTGQNATFTEGLNTRLATTVDFVETAAELTNQLGMNAQNVFTPDVIAGAAELKNTMGLAANEAAGLALIAQTTGGDIDATTSAVVDQVSAFNQANRSAVSQGLVLKDVATASDGIKASFAGMPGQLAKAASAARRLGMELSDLDGIASSLLDFESSIQNELEAQLLTGKNINMAKARELALNNDLNGLGKEIFKNASDLNEFGKMNRIQQEAQAKALGLTRDQLGKIAYQRAIEAGMTEDQAAAAAGVRKEDMQRMAVQEKINMLIGKLAQAFGPVLEVLVPIVDLLGSIVAPIAGFIGAIVKAPPVLFAIKAALLGIAAAKAFSFGKDIIAATQNAARLGRMTMALAKAKKLDNLASLHGNTLAKQALKMNKAEIIVGRIQAGIVKTKAAMQKLFNMSMIKSTISTIKNTIATKAQNAADFISNAYLKIKTALLNTSIAAKIRDIFTTNSSTAATTANTAATNAGTLAQRIQNSALYQSIAARAAQIGNFIRENALRLFNASAIGAQTAATAAQTGVNYQNAASQTAASTAGRGFAATLAGLATALVGFATAVGPFVPILLGVGAAIALASVALFPLAKMVVGVAKVIGGVLMKALEMIPNLVYAVADGFSLIMDSISLKRVAALALVGPALISVAAGLAFFSTTALAAIPGLFVLGSLAAMGDKLLNAGNGVKLIAENITKLTDALNQLNLDKLDQLESLMKTSSLTMPAIAAAGPAAAAAISAVGGGGDSESDDKVVAKIQELIDLVGTGQIVELKLDSDTITKQQMISLSKGK